MIEFGTITSKTIRAPFETEVSGFKVAGSATYNKENRLTDAYGAITIADGENVCSFNIYGDNKGVRINLNDCPADRMYVAAEIAQSVLTELSATCPKE